MPVLLSTQPRRLSKQRDKDTTPSKQNPGKQSPAKSLDIGQSLGLYDTAPVREKVRKWQAQGGGVVTPLDGLALDSDGEAVAKDQAASNPRSDGNAKSTGETRSRSVSPAKVAIPKEDLGLEDGKIRITYPKSRHNELDEDLRQASAPKKRVVSDEHWRKSKSPHKEVARTERARPNPNRRAELPNAWVRPKKKTPVLQEKAEEEVVTPSPEKAEFRGMGDDGIRVYPTHRKRRSNHSSSLDQTDMRRGSMSSRSDEESGREERDPSATPGLAGKHHREYREGREKSPRAEKLSKKGRAQGDISNSRRKARLDRPLRDFSADERTSSGSEIPAKCSSSRRRQTSRNADVPHDGHLTEFLEDEHRYGRRRSARRSSYTAQPVGASEVPVPLRPTSATVPRVFGSRVEAWLGSTPDPFLEPSGETQAVDISGSCDWQGPTFSGERFTDGALERSRSVGRITPDRERASRRQTPANEPRYCLSTSDSVITHDLGSLSNSSVALNGEFTIERSSMGTPPLLKRNEAKHSSQSPRRQPIPSPPPPTTTRLDDDVVSSAASSSVDASTFQIPSPGYNPRNSAFPSRRPFPSTGKRLSTIVSVETFNTKARPAAPSVSEGSEATVHPTEPAQYEAVTGSENINDRNPLSRPKSQGTSLKRKLTTHADLISVLSLPGGGSKSIISARSIRTNRSRLANATIGDLMNELASDEVKYMRELRTLVDGVIPVLLTCVLSKSDSAVAAGLFSRSSAAQNDLNITKPVVDMGVVLERLKSIHKRISLQDPDTLLSWAQNAQKVYADYLKAWRLGFQDVVVNLAPGATDGPSAPEKSTLATAKTAWDEGLPRNEEGYVVNGDGERVDVAFLLKRPLVRLKYLAKTLKGINTLRPSEQADTLATTYQNLVTEARKRTSEERARLEDEAAAVIDPTRARDPRSLAPLAGVRIDPTRCVRARDYFDLHLPHSSGQVVDCRVEFLLRDESSGQGSGGDLLICEADATGRWLLFPPIQLSRVSARNGDLRGEFVVMIRGVGSHGQEWQELMTLGTNDEQTGSEWVQMLGSTPVPPQLSRIQNFTNKHHRPVSSQGSSLLSVGTGSTPPVKSRTPSPREIDVPIGERAGAAARQWGRETPDRSMNSRRSPEVSPTTPPSRERAKLQKSRTSPVSPPSPLAATQTIDHERNATLARLEGSPSTVRKDCSPRSLNEAMTMAGNNSPTGLKRAKAKRYKSGPQSPIPPDPTRGSYFDTLPQESKTSSLSDKTRSAYTSTTSSVSQSSRSFSVWYPPSETAVLDETDGSDEEVTIVPFDKPSPRPRIHRRTSSAPSDDLPTIPKLRKSSAPNTPTKTPVQTEQRTESWTVPRKEVPKSTPSKLQKKRPESTKVEPKTPEQAAPAPPPHRSRSPVQLKGTSTPQLTASQSGTKTHRRSSSPLKYEYQPSTASESSSESEGSVLEDDDSITSESSEDDALNDDIPLHLKPFGAPNLPYKVSPPESIYSLPNQTLSPSQSASQAPYRTVPQQPAQATKTTASIFSWSDAGSWQSLHPDECSIVITPGLIEAYETSAAHSQPSSSTSPSNSTENSHTHPRPLIALELTPLVPLRRGTALDITIRSPPTPASRLHPTSTNILFRSRSAPDCDALYALINTSRINNPTYLALQAARGPYADSSWAAAMDRRNAERTVGGSWWAFGGAGLGRRTSYRAGARRATSAASESSVGTMASAFSALKRFSHGGGRGLFGIGRGAASSHDDGSGSSASFGDEASGAAGAGEPGSGASTPGAAGGGGGAGGGAGGGDVEPGRAGVEPGRAGMPLGIRDTKIRLYQRETQNKWRDMGSARLAIMAPSPAHPASSSPAAGGGPQHAQGGSPRVLQTGMEKRIVVLGKTKGECLLDVTLGESCFERVARTGIAVSVWEDVAGPAGVGTVRATGGVGGQTVRVYMIQMKSERECAYSFSLLGKLRY